MKPFNNFRRRLLPAAAMAAAIAAAFAGCTKVDDTLGGNLIPENQQMKAGYVELLGEGLNPRKYVETRLFQSDSLIGSNISYGYFGTCINDTLGERKAGFLSQMINYYKVDEGYFGYMPIFDSAQIMLKIASIGRDSLTKQKFAVYEILSNDYIDKKPIAAGKSQADTTFYINFDPQNPNGDGSAAPVYNPEKPLFWFYLGGEGTTPSTATNITLEPTEEGKNYIKRLMLQEGEYKDDYSIYSPDSLEYWIKEFKGLYICPDPNEPVQKNGIKETGTIFSTSLDYSGLAVFGRNRVEGDPTLIKDTIGMVYYFYESGTEFGNVSVNSIRHNYDAATSDAKIDISQAREVNPDGTINENRGLNSRVYAEGMGGVVTEMTFTPEFFARMEEEIAEANEKDGKDFKTLAFGQTKMSVYFTDSKYDWEELTFGSKLIDEMNAFPSRLGMYTNFKALTPISDYAYSYEQNYNTSLAYGGYINRSRGCYVMDITGYMQQLWNSYIKAKEAAGGVIGDIDWDKVANRTVYIGPDAYSLYSTSFGVLQGMAADGNEAPIRFEIFYNLIK